MELDLQIAGLIFDAVGVLILGMAFFAENPASLMAKAVSVTNYSPKLLKSAATQKVDGTVGTATLFIGFSLQVTFQLGYVGECAANICVGLLAGFLAVFCIVLRRWWVSSLCARAVPGNIAT